MPPVFSVIFPVYENLDTLRLTLPAILEQSLPAHLTHEVVAVDDGSGPAVGDWLAAQEHPALTVVRLPANTGRAAARNAGFHASAGNVVVFLDSDVVVHPDFLTRHAEALGIFRAGAALDERLISLGRVIDVPDLAAARAGPAPRSRPAPGNFTTQNVAVARALLARVAGCDGPFDAVTFQRYGWEDLELELRLRDAGARRVRAGRALGFHYLPPFDPAHLPAMLTKEADRAAMGQRFLALHPRLAVRLMVQATPLHRALWALLSLGGLANERTLAPLLASLSGRGWRGLAGVLARNCVLNPAYMRHLRAAFRKSAAQSDRKRT